MNCPGCGAESSVSRTVKGTKTVRQRFCSCGARWTTTEAIDRGSLVLLDAPNSKPTMLLGATGRLLDATNGHRESVSDLNSSLPTLSDQTPDLTSVVSKQEPFKYPQAFDVFWQACKGTKGNKHPAFKAWNRRRPPTNAPDVWNRWMQTDGWQRGFAKHMATWINALGWQDEPTDADMRPRGPAAVGNGQRETWEATKERERLERREREQAALEREVAATAAQVPNRCARHLYNRTWGDCNPRCPEWKAAANVG